MDTILHETEYMGLGEFGDKVCEKLGDDLYNEHKEMIDAQLERLYYQCYSVYKAYRILIETFS